MRPTRGIELAATVLAVLALAAELGGIAISASRSRDAGRQMDAIRRSSPAAPVAAHASAELATRAIELTREIQIEKARVRLEGPRTPARIEALARESAASAGVAVLGAAQDESRRELELVVEAPAAPLMAWLSSLDRGRLDWPVTYLLLDARRGGSRLEATLRLSYGTGERS